MLEIDTWLSNVLRVKSFNLRVRQRGPIGEVIPPYKRYFVTAKVPDKNKLAEELVDCYGYRRVNIQVRYRLNLIEASSSFQHNKNAGNESSLTYTRHNKDLTLFAGLFIYDRFSVDPEIPCDWSYNVKSTWLAHPSSNSTRLIAMIDNNPVGVVVYRIESVGEIELLCVDPMQRGKGIAKALVGMVASEMLSKNVTQLFVGTQNENKESCKLYEKIGFIRISELLVLHKTEF